VISVHVGDEDEAASDEAASDEAASDEAQRRGFEIVHPLTARAAASVVAAEMPATRRL
jgi:hypothetical protein